MTPAKIVYLFSTESLSDATTSRLGADMLKNLPGGTPIPDDCRTVPLQIAAGATKAQLTQALGAKAQQAAGCTKTLCVVTAGSDSDAQEGFLVGF